jgi:hypothetical protein
MTRFGYDPDGGHLFRWDGEFHYEGEVAAAPSGAKRVSDRVRSRMVGAAFLVGLSGPSVSISCDGEGLTFGIVSYGNGKFNVDVRGEETVSIFAPNRVPIIASGDICGNPELLGTMCQFYSARWIRPCPLAVGLEAFGALAEALVKEGLEKPRQAPLTVPFSEDVDGADCQEFDPVMNADGLGRMANLVAKGKPVLNQMRKGPCVREFYGSVVSRDGKGTWMMMSGEATRMFPSEPASLKSHVARFVPVQVESTEKFREATGCDDVLVDLLVASDAIPGSTTFLKMYFPYSGRKAVCLVDPKSSDAPRNAPVFRYNRGWRMSEDRYREVAANGASGVLRQVRDGGEAAAEVPESRAPCGAG